MERRDESEDFLSRDGLAAPTAPAVITNPDLSHTHPSGEVYVSLTIQSLVRETGEVRRDGGAKL